MEQASVWTAGVSWGLYFAAYNQAKVRWQRMGGQDELSPVQHLLAAAEGGAVVRLEIPQTLGGRTAWS